MTTTVGVFTVPEQLKTDIFIEKESAENPISWPGVFWGIRHAITKFQEPCRQVGRTPSRGSGSRLGCWAVGVPLGSQWRLEAYLEEMLLDLCQGHLWPSARGPGWPQGVCAGSGRKAPGTVACCVWGLVCYKVAVCVCVCLGSASGQV